MFLQKGFAFASYIYYNKEQKDIQKAKDEQSLKVTFKC